VRDSPLRIHAGVASQAAQLVSLPVARHADRPFPLLPQVPGKERGGVKTYVVITRHGWLAYRSRWAYMLGREPILRARTWAAMSTALESLKKRRGAGGKTRALRMKQVKSD
jgi:hypothetical protein